MERRNFVMTAAAVVGQSLVSRWTYAQSPRITVRIGWQPGFAARLYVARDLGFIEKAGLDAEFLKFVSGPPMLAALKAGDVDIAFMSANPALAGMAEGIDLRVILIDSDELRVNGLVVRPGAGIANLSDIKGKKIGVTRGSASYYGLKKAMAEVGLSDKDVQILNMPLPTWIPAFNAGDVDGLWVWSPWLSKIEQQGGKVVATLDTAGITLAQNLYVAREAWLDSNPEGARRFIYAMQLATTALTQDPAVGVKAVSRALDIPNDLAQALFSNQVMPTLRQMADPAYKNSLVGDGGVRKGLREQGEFLYSEGFLKQKPDFAKTVDSRPLQAFLASQK